MSGGGQIKNVLTLDVTKFNEAIDKATANLGTLDKQLKSASKMAADFEKGVASMGGDLTGVSSKFKLLDQSISSLVSRLDKAGSSGLDGFSSKARKAKKDISELSKAADDTGGTLLNLTDWFKRYGQAVEKINPVVHEVIDSQRKLSAASREAAADTKAASTQQIEARLKQLEAERLANRDTVASRSKMVSDLKQLDSKMAGQQAELERNASRFFGKNAGKGNGYRSRATEIQQDRDLLQIQLRQVEQINEALRYENVQIGQGIALLKDQLVASKALAAQEEAAANTAIEAEAARARAVQRRKELMTYMAAEEKRIANESLKTGKLAERVVSQQAKPGYQAAGKDWWEAQFAAQTKAQAKADKQAEDDAKRAAREKAQVEREAAAESKRLSREKAQAEREAAAEAKRVARELSQADRERQAEIKRASAERMGLMRQEAAEARRTAAERLASERETARQIAQMWKGMGQLWGASKIENGLKAGVGEASKYQQADMRLKLLNLPADEQSQFTSSAKALSRQEGYLSETEALKARTDALTAIGHNDPKLIDATLPSAVRNAQVMMSAGYEHGDRSDLVKNLYGFAEARQVMGDPNKVNESFDIARRLGVASGGKINIADLETVARNIGDLRQTMSSDGWIAVASLMEQFKVAGSHGAGGAGAGVSSVGTMLKMMSLYAAGKPVTDQAAIQLLGAGVMNDPTSMSGQDLKDQATSNNQMRRMIKTAGFKGVDDMAANPVAFFSGLRGQVLDYTKSDANKGKFYKPGASMDDPLAESAAMKQFFAKTGMSQKTVDGLLIMMDKGFIERSQHVQEMAKKAADEQQAVEEMRKTWANSVDEMNAGASKMATAFTPLLEPLSAIPRALGQILTKAAEFAGDNPLQANASLAAVAFGGLTLAVKGTLTTFGIVGGVISGIQTMLGGGTAAVEASTVAWGATQRMLATLALTFPNVSTVAAAAFETVWGWGTRLAAPFVSLGATLLAPFAAVGAGAAGAIGWIGTMSATLLGFVAKWASPAGWLLLAGQVGWVIGKWISDIQVGGVSIGGHMQNIFLDIEVGWKKLLLNVEEKWLDFKKFIGGSDYLGEQADREALAAKRGALAQYDRSMRIEPEYLRSTGENSYTSTGDGRRSADGQGNGGYVDPRIVKGTPAAPAATTAPGLSKDALKAFGGTPKPGADHGAFENAFARQFYSADTRANIEQLKLDSVNTGDNNFMERARQEVIKMWAGGDLDDGKDAKKRKFVSGSTTDKNGNTLVGGKGYDPKKGWGIDQMDWSASADIGNGEKKTLTDLQEEIAKRLELVETIKAVSFAKERARASDSDLSAATERLTDDTAGQTDAMKALNREFAQQEARNPAVKDSKDYQTNKQKALGNRAASDYLNMGADLRQKGAELGGSLLPTERQRLEASVNAQYEAERKKADAVRKGLDEQIKAMEANGQDCTVEYYKLTDARKAAEDDFTRYLELIQRQREEALLTPIQKMAKEWKDTYAQLQTAQVSWANGFADNITKAITGGKVSWKDFARSILEDLTKIMVKQALLKGFDWAAGTSVGQGIAGMAGQAGQIGAGMTSGSTIVGGGMVGDWLNKMRGMQGQDIGPQLPKGITPDVGAADAASASDAAAKSLGDTASSAEALTVAHTAQAGAVQATTVATVADTTATQASTVATMTNATATESDVVATMLDTTATEASSTAVIFNTATEYAEATANEVSATTEYLANGGVATPKGLSFFANGGAFTNSVVNSPTMFKFANGGQFGVMGEAGPEAVMPLSRDGSGRLGVTVNGGAAGGGTSVVIEINVAGGASDTSSSGDTQGEWTKMANRVRGVVMEELANQQRPGGALYR